MNATRIQQLLNQAINLSVELSKESITAKDDKLSTALMNANQHLTRYYQSLTTVKAIIAANTPTDESK
jgi:hypothetical protein